jgi:hypothetical protein
MSQVAPGILLNTNNMSHAVIESEPTDMSLARGGAQYVNYQLPMASSS